MTALVLSECFGPTYQGEGPSTGRRCGFVRLGRCNLDCAWCDTPWTWDWSGANGTVYDPSTELDRVDVDAVVARVRDMNVGLVVVTGGEPMLQRSGLTDLVDALAPTHDIEIETNGTRAPWPALVAHGGVRFNVSPKLANSECDPTRRYDPYALDALVACGRARFKFVVCEPTDLAEVGLLVERHAIDASSVWIMPEGRTDAEQAARRAAIACAALAYGYNLSGRLHVAIWGDQRGH